MRRKSKEIKIGNILIGADNPIAIQSMTNTDTHDAESTAQQINELHDAGAHIVRFTVPDESAARSVSRIRSLTKAAIVADIHFNYRIALMCIDAGIDKIRINPGNIGSPERVREVAKKAIDAKIPIRIGVNAGSLEAEFYKKYGKTARAMVESAKYHASLLENEGMTDIVLSLKASDVRRTVDAYRLIAKGCDYPLHVGITEAGTSYSGIIKSSAGIGALLLDGIGDTIRVSLTDNPVEEVRAAKALLSALDLREAPQLISCPVCGRCKYDLISVAKAAEKYLEKTDKPIKVAVMGCAVNGPGEASEADIGVAGGNGNAIIFRKGKIVKTVAEKDIITELFSEIDKIIK